MLSCQLYLIRLEVIAAFKASCFSIISALEFCFAHWKAVKGLGIKNELLAGHPVICSVGPGDFTQIGHFIVLVGWEDDKVIVHDPFSIKNTEKRWVYEDFKDQIKSMWTYSMEE